jgi:hypothetical protein
MKFKIGDKVIVRTYPTKPSQWSDEMFGLSGKTVTIHRTGLDRYWLYSIEEAQRWVWREKDLLSVSDQENPNYLFMNRRK